MLSNSILEDETKPFASLRILDFSWVISGPLGTKLFADYGATVIKIESEIRLDITRTYVPMAEDIPGVNRCAFFAAYNSNKMSMQLNLNHPSSRDIIKKLIAWADLVVENYVAGTMEKWNLSYEDIKQINPKIIMIRAGIFGQEGPYRKATGFGGHLCSLSGIDHLVGWPDRPPVGVGNAYTDFTSPWFMILAIIGALDHLRRTGKGQCIDLSQFETGVSFITPAILNYSTNGVVERAQGNRSKYASPHGAYKCLGDDRWCVIAINNDEQWQLFVDAIGKPDWAVDPRFANFEGRKENEDALDKLIEGWTIEQRPEDVMVLLQGVGVPSGVVQTGEDLHKDPQLEHRNHFRMLKHPEMGTTAYDRYPFRFSETKGDLTEPAPCLGEHTEYVCTKILNISDEEFLKLLEDDVFL